jgi:hypothetical protein
MPKPQPPAIQLELDRQEFAWRLANCFIHSTLVDVVRALQVLWLPNPQPDVLAGQHWQIYLEGLVAGRMATVWDQASGRRLAMVRSNQRGQLDISMVIPEERALDAVIVTFDDRAFMTAAEFREALAQVPLVAEPTGPMVSVQQTVLTPLASVSLGGVGDRIELLEHEGDVYLSARGFERRAETFRITSGRTVSQVVPAVLGTERKRAGEDTADYPAAARVAVVDGRRTCQIMGHDSGQEVVVAHYWGRPWFDGGAVLGRSSPA